MSKTFGNITQLGYVVKDINATIKYFTQTLGIGPFLVLPDIKFSDFKYRGHASEAPTLTIALANSGDLQIELIQQHDDQPSIYKEFIDQGKEGLQHFSSWLTNSEMEPKKAELSEQGYTLVQEGAVPEMGGLFLYYGTDEVAIGSMFEVANLNDPSVSGIADLIKQAAANWDGKNERISL